MASVLTKHTLQCPVVSTFELRRPLENLHSVIESSADMPCDTLVKIRRPAVVFCREATQYFGPSYVKPSDSKVDVVGA